MDFESQLSTAMHQSVDPLRPPVPDLVSGGLVRGRRLRRRRRIVVAASAVVVLLFVVVVGVGAVRDDPATTTAAGPGACRSVVSTGVLPVWARAGFSDEKPAVSHVLGEKGLITAILFGQQLHAPPSDTVNNKILWAAKDFTGEPGALRIDAVRAGTTTHVHREVPGGPGPSTIDLPAAGCWHVDLRWGANRDSMDLEYVAP